MIPLSVPNISGNEWTYIKECLDTNWVSSVGSYVTKFEKTLAEYTGAKYAIATSNGTAALHISLQLAGVERGDLVVIPNITFVATANAVKYTGADPVMIDIDTNTWQMDLGLLEEFLQTHTEIREGFSFHKKLNRRISAIVPVHVLGNMCDMDQFIRIAQKYRLTIVEDSTEALGSKFRGKHAGTFGLFGTSSFNGNKIISTGGGGMILTNEEKLAAKAKHLTTQAKADPNEYYHDETGYNYRLVNILAAMGVAQMEQLDAFIKRKKVVAQMYKNELSFIEGFKTQKVIEGVEPNHWLFTAKVPEKEGLIAHLKSKGVEARSFWVPMNRLPMMTKDLYFTHNDISQDVYQACVSLPCSTSIKDDEVNQVIQFVKDFYSGL
jgi:perosamine synthetase